MGYFISLIFIVGFIHFVYAFFLLFKKNVFTLDVSKALDKTFREHLVDFYEMLKPFFILLGYVVLAILMIFMLKLMG